jgi:hypothetical protein
MGQLTHTPQKWQVSLSLLINLIADVIQGELEHRNSKARYRRTDRKAVVKQLTQIERRQARIRRIRQKHQATTKITRENVANTPDEHHHIGKSEKCFEQVGDFLQSHTGDPAVKVWLGFKQ